MNEEKIGLLITGVICLFGCVFLSVYNVVEANYTKAEIISKWDYNEGFIPESSTENNADSSGSDSVSPLFGIPKHGFLNKDRDKSGPKS